MDLKLFEEIFNEIENKIYTYLRIFKEYNKTDRDFRKYETSDEFAIEGIYYEYGVAYLNITYPDHSEYGQQNDGSILLTSLENNEEDMRKFIIQDRINYLIGNGNQLEKEIEEIKNSFSLEDEELIKEIEELIKSKNRPSTSINIFDKDLNRKRDAIRCLEVSCNRLAIEVVKLKEEL